MTEPTPPALPTEPEPEAIEPDAVEPEAESAPELAPPARRSRSTIVLAAVAAVLLVFGVTMTILYQRQASARAARDRAVAARDAQLAGLRAQLAALQAQSTDLQAKLKAAQDKQLDPAGYEQIKKCVQENAANEQMIAKFLAEAQAGGDIPNGGVVTRTYVARGAMAPGGDFKEFKAPTTCTDAVKFLK
jgi:uncharacterized protein HemX